MSTKHPLEVDTDEVIAWAQWAQMSSSLSWAEMALIERLAKVLNYKTTMSVPSTATTLALWEDVQRIAKRLV
jgi:hypothetical protein